MFKIAIFCILTGGTFDFVKSMGESMIETGNWEVLAIKECPDPDKYPIKTDIQKKKMDRTHDAFDAKMNFDEPFGEGNSIMIKICKWVDGGCKDYSTLSDAEIIDFMIKMCENNLKQAMEMMNIGGFPVDKGEYGCETYVIDYCEFPCKSVVGTYDAEIKVMDQDNVEKACLIATVEFTKPEDEEELCEKCKE